MPQATWGIMYYEFVGLAYYVALIRVVALVTTGFNKGIYITGKVDKCEA